MIMCAILVTNAVMDDQEFTRVRRAGGQGRKVELRVASRRAECALAAA